MSARQDIADRLWLSIPSSDNDEAKQRAEEMLDAYRAEILAEAKVEVVAWLVKKAAEGTPVGELASKVDRGAVRIFLGTGHYRDAMDAHRAEVLNEAAAVAESSVALFEGSDETAAAAGAMEGLAIRFRRMASEEATAAAATATPDFFVPGRTYAREHHGDTIQFLVGHVSTSPDGRYRVAHGWRTRSWDPGWEPSDSDDFTVWVDVTKAGDGS